MRDFETELIDAWLKTCGFLTRVGLPGLLSGKTILATRVIDGVSENLHVEHKVSFMPTHYLCGNMDTTERTEEEIQQAASIFVDKLFTGNRVVQGRNRILDGKWDYLLVVGETRSEFELICLRKLGIKTLDFKDVVQNAVTNRSALGTLTEIRRTLSVINYLTD